MAIVLDGMGGDFAPKAAIEGALVAAESGLKIYLVGPEDVLNAQVASVPNIEVVHASDVVTMSDSPAEVIRKRQDSSIVVGVKLAKQLDVPFVSAGNTGACMAAALFTFGRLPGIKRPPIASIFPQINGGSCVILDVGANVDCDSANLLNFANMGNAYAKTVLGVEVPRVGLLSNGEEKEKGNALTLETHDLLSNSSLNFIGNVEGFDVLSGRCDVIVCDGFVGNILLKNTEGVVKGFHKLLNLGIGDPANLSPDLAAVLKRLKRFNPDNREHSGAPLLGINGTCFIVHGGADSRTIAGALQGASKLGDSGLMASITECLGS